VTRFNDGGTVSLNTASSPGVHIPQLATQTVAAIEGAERRAGLDPARKFLTQLGTREPAGEVYTTIGGDPWLWRWLRSGHHGFDGAVPAESPFLQGAARYTFPQTHGRLLRAGDPTTLTRRVTALAVT